jgi:NAD(P)-dependent dehydrogenase (short-subunit alcohol dehydrogenase family)
MQRLDGLVAIVTGSGSGIGAACARRLALQGAEVVLADIDVAAAEDVASELLVSNARAYALRLDISDEKSILAFYAAVFDRSGRVDILHNNAAELSPEILGRDMALEHMVSEVWDRAFIVNVRGTMLMSKYVLPLMIAAGHGSIINTSSTAALLGGLENPAYAASKAAINCLTQYIATQYGKHGIRCNAVAPGLIMTPKIQRFLSEEQLDGVRRHTLTPQLGEPNDIASAVAWLASNDAKFVTGQIIAVDGGITTHLPFVADRLSDFHSGAAQP